MREVAIIGAGMTRFAKHLDRSMKDLAREAIEGALNSSSVEKSALEAVAVGNAMAGLITGQECIRGQVVLREMGIGGIPVINTENACASAATAFHLAWLYVASGMYDVVMAVGMEKLFHEDKKRSFAAIGSAIDVELMQQTLEKMKASNKEKGEDGGAGKSRSMFMEFYAEFARDHMRKYGTTNAAVILTSAENAKKFTTKPVYVKASVLGSGKDRNPGDPGVTERIAKKAYEVAGLGPEDLHVAEVHDASSPAELIIYEELGLCKHGEGGRLIDEGVTALGGRTPVNPSGGLLAKGHPVGATGVAQIAEIFWQLRGEAGKRQVEGAKVGLTENGGGMVRGEAAALAVHILTV